MRLGAFKKSYGGKTVLNFPGIELEQGKIYAVIGANGSGKSTLAKVVSGVEKPDEGKFKVPCKTGYMPQKSFAFRMTVRKNLMQNGKDNKKAEKLMEDMGIAHLAEKKANRLSGGETARMALCRLFMKAYELIILDEPTAAMDMESTLLAEKLIREYMSQTGCAVLIITHSLSQAARLADTVLFFSNGELAEWGSAQKLMTDPKDERTKNFLKFINI